MTFINLDARLPPTATLCMPGFPPRHVCVAERRVLLTYLLITPRSEAPHHDCGVPASDGVACG
jgi:hypothetical protein